MSASAAPKTTDPVIAEFSAQCLLMRTRLISRVLTGIYDQALREFGISSPQFSMLVLIARMGPVSRAEIGRYHHQERSTLTRNFKIMTAAGWIAESPENAGGRARPLQITAAGTALLHQVEPAWRAAQKRVKALLGEANVLALDDMVNRIRKAKPVA